MLKTIGIHFIFNKGDLKKKYIHLDKIDFAYKFRFN